MSRKLLNNRPARPDFNFDMFVIVCDLPDGLNYYCGTLLIEGRMWNEWDTDKRYCKRFMTKVEAENYMRVVVRLAEARVIELDHYINPLHKA